MQVNDGVREVVRKKNTLPRGVFFWTCCAECPAGEYDANKRMVWCGKYREWNKGSSGCSNGPNG